MEDKIIRAMAQNGMIRIIACDSTNLCNELKTIHNLNDLTTIVFGRFMSIVSMISATNKVEQDTISIRIDGEGPLNFMSATTKGDGTLKGILSNPNAFVENFKIEDLIGEGFLTFVKDLGLKNPYSSRVPLYKKNINDDFAYYYTLSEQTPTAIDMGIILDENLNVKSSVGLMVQMMPGADEMLSDLIAYRFEDLGSIVSNLENGKTLNDILNFMFDDMNFKIIEERNLKYNCDCSSERVERALVSLGKDELEKMINEGKDVTLVCDYCNQKYNFTSKNIKDLYNNKKKDWL